MLLGLPLFFAKVPPNQWYGVRIPKTMRDHQIWYRVNAEAGQCFIMIGGILVVISILLPIGQALAVLQPQAASRIATIALAGSIACMILWLGVIVSRA